MPASQFDAELVGQLTYGLPSVLPSFAVVNPAN